MKADYFKVKAWNCGMLLKKKKIESSVPWLLDILNYDYFEWYSINPGHDK